MATELGRTMGAALREIVEQIEAGNLHEEKNVAGVNKLDFDGRLKAKMRRQIRTALQRGWSIGIKHAQTEIDRAQGKHFSAEFNAQRLNLIGSEFFDSKSFAITGKLNEDALNTIRQIIYNGAKNGRSLDEVRDEIIDRFARDGMLDRESVLEAYADATDADYPNPQARLETLVRTNTFEAINEARYGYFTDPILGDFVEAFEYSAILDERTTEICECLDGTIQPKGDAFWDTFNPPNHFNCRSLLIPITAVDQWDAVDNGCGPPQKGFG